MAKTDQDDESGGQAALSQLIDMFVYAPIGMLYEYPDVLPQLIKKGKSQVQLARVISEFALKKGQDNPETFAGAGGAIAKIITEVADSMGLTPSTGSAPEPSRTGRAHPDPADETTPDSPPAGMLPIVGYDNLTAREIVSLLVDITPAQRARVRAYELANRSRKTVLAKLDQLGD